MSVNERAIPRRSSPLLAPFAFRDFRLLWTGLLISNLGTWMQITAIGYFVAHGRSGATTALYLGLIGGARMVSVFVCSPVAGVVADTFPRRAILIAANVVLVLEALALAILTQLGMMSIGGLIVISAISSAAQSFDAPARQSWLPLMVDRAHVGTAIGLNSVAFNAPAVIGPAIAGVLIVSAGIAGSFYINAVATLAVVVAVLMMRPSPASTTRREPLLLSIRNGARFLAGHAILKWVIGSFVVTALLVRPYGTLLPAFAVSALHAGARGYSLALAAAGVGAFGGAFLTAYLGQRERRGAIWLVSGATMSLGVAALGFIWNLWLALPVLILIGCATLSFLGSSNTMIQMLSPDELRGRAVSVYTMVALGGVQGGALIVGGIAVFIGIHAAFAIAGAVCFAMIAWIAFSKPILRTV
ncbi:MAG TPA: MFS transporter [Candidatus Aquilonibacter sp.]